MNVLVLMKRVPDTETRIQVRDGQVLTEGISWVISPYDEYAVEEGLRLVEKHGGKVTLVTCGPEEAKETIRKGLALGANEAYHLNDPAFAGGDAVSTSKVLPPHARNCSTTSSWRANRRLTKITRKWEFEWRNSSICRT
jgi:electron transfer flavoprotein beta subunit